MQNRFWVVAVMLAVLGLAGAALAFGPATWPEPGWRGLGGWGARGLGCPGPWSAPVAWSAAPAGERISFEEAVSAAERYLASAPGDLEIRQVMEFERSFYVTVHDATTGRGAFALLVHPTTSAVRPEPGPNMMWNTEYGTPGGRGIRGGMMGGSRGAWGPAGTTGNVLDEASAREAASRWLARAFPGAGPTEALLFPGYYTLEFERDGKILGMLSVNLFTGQVWFHSWHGAFIAERDYGDGR